MLFKDHIELLRTKFIKSDITTLMSWNHLVHCIQPPKFSPLDGIPTRRVTYVGAAGKIGSKSLALLIEGLKKHTKTDIVLVGSERSGSKERLTGMKLDLIEYASSLNKQNYVSIKVTDSYADTKDTDVTICSAGLWPSLEERRRMIKIDPTGRAVQTTANFRMVKKIAAETSKYSPSSLFLLATNQVDTLSELSRHIAPSSFCVLGLSGSVDSARFKIIAREVANKRAKAYMIGYHNADQIPLLSSLAGQKLTDAEMAEIVKVCRMRGKNIADLQRAGMGNVFDTGASILPAGGLARATLAFLGHKHAFTESWNVELKNKQVADMYGLSVGESLSVPLKIGNGFVSYYTKFPVTEHEKQLIKKMRVDMIEAVELVKKAE